MPAPRPPSDNTRKAYTSDWAHYTRWCRMTGTPPLPPSGDTIAHYVTYLATTRGLSPASIGRRLSGLVWNSAQRGVALDRQDHRITRAMAAIQQAQPRPPTQKHRLTSADIRAMLATLPHDLRGLRDRAMLAVGFAAGLGRTQIVGLDCGLPPASPPYDDAGGWIQPQNDALLLTLRNRTSQRIPRAPGDQACPVAALDQWLHYARITHGPLFTRVSRDGQRALGGRMNDRHVARLIKRSALAAGLRPDLFSGQSLRPKP